MIAAVAPVYYCQEFPHQNLAIMYVQCSCGLSFLHFNTNVPEGLFPSNSEVPECSRSYSFLSMDRRSLSRQ